MKNENSNPEVTSEEQIVTSEEQPLEELSQEELLAIAKEQREKLEKAMKKAHDQEGRAKKLEEQLKGKKEVKEEPEVKEEEKKEPEVVTKDELADTAALLQAGINHPQDIETLNRYRGSMSMAEALADPNIKSILAKNKADREAEEKSKGLQGISGIQSTLTDKQFLEQFQANPAMLNDLSPAERQRVGRLLAQS